MSEIGEFGDDHLFISSLTKHWLSSNTVKISYVHSMKLRVARLLHSSHQNLDPANRNWTVCLTDYGNQFEYLYKLKNECNMTAQTTKNYVGAIMKAITFANDKENEKNKPDLDLCRRLGVALRNWETYKKNNSRHIARENQDNIIAKENNVDGMGVEIEEVLNTLETLLEEMKPQALKNLEYLEQSSAQSPGFSIKKRYFNSSTQIKKLIPESLKIALAWTQLVRYITSAILVRNSHRPGVVQNMKMEEVENVRVNKSGKTFIIRVREHKTAQSHPALVVINSELWEIVQRYRVIRLCLNDNQSTTFFINTEGNRCSNWFKDINKELIKRKMPKINATALRTLYSTQASKYDETTRRQVASALCHSERTSKLHYRAGATETAIENYKTLKRISKLPSKRNK